MSTVIEVDDVWKKVPLGDHWHRHAPSRFRAVVAPRSRQTRPVFQGGSGEHEIRNAKSELATNFDHQISGASSFIGRRRDVGAAGVSFEVKQGEILGIIGRNGAGKSTLLKILSRVTAPTSGEVRVKGRIASLLEVGTGFHPELTGRENVFLNGAILGMTKAEIRKKLDEIVDFAGVERFMDTPVKRYSSGMYVRLAFAVAAHLEPEILIWTKCWPWVICLPEKMYWENARCGKSGRTVLFVSHNLDMIRKLCRRAALLADGRLQSLGAVEEVADSSP